MIKSGAVEITKKKIIDRFYYFFINFFYKDEIKCYLQSQLYYVKIYIGDIMEELMSKLIEESKKLKEQNSGEYKEFLLGWRIDLGYDKDGDGNIFGSLLGIYEKGIVVCIENGGLGKYDNIYRYLIIIKDGCQPEIIQTLTGSFPISKHVNEEIKKKAMQELGERVDEKIINAKYKKGFINKSIVALNCHKLDLLVSKYFEQCEKYKNKTNISVKK